MIYDGASNERRRQICRERRQLIGCRFVPCNLVFSQYPGTDPGQFKVFLTSGVGCAQ